MKKTLLITLTLFIAGQLMSQITTTTSEKPVLIGKVQYFDCTKSDDMYIFTYRDLKYTHITETKSFSLSEDDFNAFYDVIQKGFDEVPKEDVTIETPDDIFKLKYYKSLGVINLRIFHIVNKNADVIGITKYLTKKATIKLFGKKKKK